MLKKKNCFKVHKKLWSKSDVLTCSFNFTDKAKCDINVASDS